LIILFFVSVKHLDTKIEDGDPEIYVTKRFVNFTCY